MYTYVCMDTGNVKVYKYVRIYVYSVRRMHICVYAYVDTYGVAMISRLIKTVGLFCKRAL